MARRQPKPKPRKPYGYLLGIAQCFLKVAPRKGEEMIKTVDAALQEGK